VGSVYVEGKWKARSLSSVAHLIVHVRDTNDQKPQFERSLYTAQVELPAAASVQFVTKLSAKYYGKINTTVLFKLGNNNLIVKSVSLTRLRSQRRNFP
jgi:hypothetical protein